VTNRDLLVGVLRHPEFLAGATDTGFLVRHDPVELARTDPGGRVRRLHGLAAALAAQARRRATAPVQASLPSGWRNVASTAQRLDLVDDDGPLVVTYRLAQPRVGHQAGTAEVTVDDEPMGRVTVIEVTGERVDLEVDGVRRQMVVARYGLTHCVDSALGSSVFTEVDRFPLPHTEEAAGSLVAPMPGAIARVECAPGQVVTAGQVLVVLEAMKMEHAIRCPHDGTVAEVRVEPGTQVETGAVLVVVAADGTEMAEPGAADAEAGHG
jgi:acetyl/propionyl-CoA carboxylase alpha subunit